MTKLDLADWRQVDNLDDFNKIDRVYLAKTAVEVWRHKQIGYLVLVTNIGQIRLPRLEARKLLADLNEALNVEEV